MIPHSLNLFMYISVLSKQVLTLIVIIKSVELCHGRFEVPDVPKTQVCGWEQVVTSEVPEWAEVVMISSRP
jgi:hypothetical protein